jgi:hypothetical protein
MQTIEEIIYRAHRKGFATEVMNTADMLIKRESKIIDLVKLYEQAYYETQSRHQTAADKNQFGGIPKITTSTRFL